MRFDHHLDIISSFCDEAIFVEICFEFCSIVFTAKTKNEFRHLIFINLCCMLCNNVLLQCCCSVALEITGVTFKLIIRFVFFIIWFSFFRLIIIGCWIMKILTSLISVTSCFCFEVSAKFSVSLLAFSIITFVSL